MAKNRLMGYVPNDTPPAGQLVLLGFQHIWTMFPATVLVAALSGFHVGTVPTISGVGTIVALLLAKWRIGKFIPLFYGSTFSYIAAYLAIAQPMTGSLPQFGVPLPDNVISTIQAGIVVTGLFNTLIGLVIRAVGKEKIDMVLPPIVTGSAAAIIGFGLAFAALGQLASANFLVSLVTLLMTLSIMGLGRKKLSRPRSRVLIPSGPQRKQRIAFCLYSGNRTRAYDPWVVGSSPICVYFLIAGAGLARSVRPSGYESQSCYR